MKATVPDGWVVEREWGPGPFITHALVRRPDGSEVEWNSRRHRKLLGFRSRSTAAHASSGTRSHASTMSLWMGSLFMVGSFCFGLGSLPWYFDAVSPQLVGVTFFVGSLFFTSAAYLQYREVVAAPTGILPDSPRPHGWRSLIGMHPRSIDWWASSVQFVGTLFFNATTLFAMVGDLSDQQQRHLIWAPDVFGSICFLVASWLAYSEVIRRRWWNVEREVAWYIGALNMLGSVAFGASAVAARYVGDSGDVANVALVNLGTFIGAVCFFAGAALLPVESAGASAAEPAAT